MKLIMFLVFLILYLEHYPCLQVIPERSIATYINEKYMYLNGTTNVRRYKRRGEYFLNIMGTNKVTFGNNVSLNLVFFEYLHNEYKRSFVEMHFKVCDLINHDQFVGRVIARTGIVCPLTPNTYKLANMSFSTDSFPNVWPFEKCKIEASLTQNENGDLITKGDFYFTFKNKLYW